MGTEGDSGKPVATAGSATTDARREGLARTGDTTPGTGTPAALAGGIVMLAAGTRRRRR